MAFNLCKKPAKVERSLHTGHWRRKSLNSIQCCIQQQTSKPLLKAAEDWTKEQSSKKGSVFKQRTVTDPAIIHANAFDVPCLPLHYFYPLKVNVLVKGQLSSQCADPDLRSIELLNWCILRSSVHILILKLGLLTNPSRHMYCWPLTAQAYRHYSLLSPHLSHLCLPQPCCQFS